MIKMKIVLFMKKLNLGGAEMSTVRLLNEFAKHGHEVTLFVRTEGGILEKDLNRDVHIKALYHDGGCLQNWNRTISGLFCIGVSNFVDAIYQYMKGSMKSVVYRFCKERYDLAITGANGYSPYFLKKYIKYNVHLQIIRSANAFIHKGEVRSFINQYYEQLDVLDGYICVSEELKSLMLQYTKVPEEKIFTIYNIIGINQLSKLYKKPKEYQLCIQGEILIVTICRLVDSVKGVFRMVDVCEALVKQGFRFRWFIVGDGLDKEAMLAMIQERNLQNQMILCGFHQEIIPYYIYADLVAVLSYEEGLCGVINEAKLLCKPLITTRFASVDEQIVNGRNGIIVENNREAIIKGMAYLLEDESRISKLAVNDMPEKLLNNKYKVEQFEELYKRLLERKSKCIF